MRKRQECILLPFVPPLKNGDEKSVLGNSREESHPKGSEKSMEGRREKERRMEKKEEGSGQGKGKGERERREERIHVIHVTIFISLNSVLKTDLQHFISHNGFEMC